MSATLCTCIRSANLTVLIEDTDCPALHLHLAKEEATT